MTDFRAYSPAPADEFHHDRASAPPRPTRASMAASKVAGGAMLAVALLCALSIATWSAADPSLTHLSTAKPANALGAPGAIISDIVLTALGLAGVLALLPPLYWSSRLLTGAGLTRVRLRALAAPVAVLALAATFSALPKVTAWPLPSGYGGLLGDLLYSFLAGSAALIVSERAGLFAALVGLASGLGLMTFSLGLTRDDIRAMARLAARPFEPDSSWVSHLKQGTVAAGIAPMAPLAAAAHPDLTRPGFTPPPLSLSPETQSDWTSHHGRHDRGYGEVCYKDVSYNQVPTYTGAIPPVVAQPSDNASWGTVVAAHAAPHASTNDAWTNAPVSTVATVATQAPAAQDAGMASVANNHAVAAAPVQPTPPPRPQYTLPPTSLLAASSRQRASAFEMSVAEKLRGDRLRDVFAGFAVQGNVTSHWTGPVVTTFVFEPQTGTKTARVLGLADDVARGLGVAAVRLQLASGRGALVVEVPHDDAIAIGMRDLVEHDAFRAASLRLPLACGATAQGEPVVADLASLPAVLIAGKHDDERAGVLRALVGSLVYRHTPATLTLAIADTDGALGALAALPHCGGHAPAIAASDAIDMLVWAASEIDARTLRLRAAAQSRTIDAYNARMTAEGGTDAMPYLVVVIADLVPLTTNDAPAFDHALHRIVREGAAVGIHIIAATSRTDDMHLPDAVRHAFPTRIAMKLASRADSRAVLDDTGAEDLIGQGDALAVTACDNVRRSFGGGTLSRLHLTRASLEAAHAITVACQPVQAATPATRATALHSPVTAAVPIWKPAASHIDDALYGRAVSLVRRVSAIDAAMFRRGLAVSYAEALALLDRLQADSIIGPEEADGQHRVLIGRAA